MYVKPQMLRHIYHLRSASQGVSVLDPVAESVALCDLAWVSLRVQQGAEPASNLIMFLSPKAVKGIWKSRMKQMKDKDKTADE